MAFQNTWSPKHKLHVLILIVLLQCLTHSTGALSSSYTPNFLYHPKEIPDNYKENAILVLKGNQTKLHKIDLKYAFCGENKINLREITIKKLQNALREGKLNSEQLVRCYLKRIKEMNPFLNAILQVNPDAIQIAKKLDEDRANGTFHGPLHGIPVLLKDSMGTHDKMETTAGTKVLHGIKPKADPEVAKKLRKAGAIIIGKANLSEFSNFRATNMPNGWSGRGGRTNNVYIRSADPCGSSSGSAVAVSANMVPVALGGETDGSIVCPARETSLVGLKPGISRVSTAGCIGISHTQDVVGPLAKTVEDAAIVFEALANKINSKDAKAFNNNSELLSKPYRIGVLRDPNWAVVVANSSEELPTLEGTLEKLQKVGFEVIDPIEGDKATLDNTTRDSEGIVFNHEFKHGLNSYLKHSVLNPQQKIKSLADGIAFNIAHPPKEGYNQENLIKAEATDNIQNKTYIQNRDKNRAECRKYVQAMLNKYKLDAIVQAGFKKNGLPFGISFYVGLNSEEKLLHIAAKLESVHKARQTSMFLD